MNMLTVFFTIWFIFCVSTLSHTSDDIYHQNSASNHTDISPPISLFQRHLQQISDVDTTENNIINNRKPFTIYDRFSPNHNYILFHSGNPPQPLRLTLDTASSLTQIDCIASHSIDTSLEETINYDQSIFHVSDSQSFQWLNCTNQNQLCKICINPNDINTDISFNVDNINHIISNNINTQQSGLCGLYVSTTTAHIAASDIFSIPTYGSDDHVHDINDDNNENTNSYQSSTINFGCSLMNPGVSYRTNTLAVDRGSNSFTQQFYQRNGIQQKQFAHYFATRGDILTTTNQDMDMDMDTHGIKANNINPKSYLAIGGDKVGELIEWAGSLYGGQDGVQWVPLYSKVFVETSSLLWADDSVSGMADYSLFEPRVPNSDLYQIVTDSLFINDVVIFSDIPSIVTIDTGDTSLSFSNELKKSILSAIFACLDSGEMLKLITNNDKSDLNQMFLNKDFSNNNFTMAIEMNVEMSDLLKHYEYCILSTKLDLLFADIILSLFSEKKEYISHTWTDFIIPSENYVVRYPSVINGYYFHCLDITFDWNGGVVLGSSSLKNSIIIYNDDTQALGILPTEPTTKYGNFYSKLTSSSSESQEPYTSTSDPSQSFDTSIQDLNEYTISTTDVNLDLNSNNNGEESLNNSEKKDNDSEDKFYEIKVNILNHDISLFTLIIILCIIGICCFILLPCCVVRCYNNRKDKLRDNDDSYEFDIVASEPNNNDDDIIGITESADITPKNIDKPKISRIRKRNTSSSRDHECKPRAPHIRDITICTLDGDEDGVHVHTEMDKLGVKDEIEQKQQSSGRSSRRSSTSSILQTISGRIGDKFSKSGSGNGRGSRTSRTSKSWSESTQTRTIGNNSNSSSNRDNNNINGNGDYNGVPSWEEQERQQLEIINQLKLLNDIENCQSDIDLSDCDNTEIFLENWQQFGSQIIQQLELGKEKMMFDTMNSDSPDVTKRY